MRELAGWHAFSTFVYALMQLPPAQVAKYIPVCRTRCVALVRAVCVRLLQGGLVHPTRQATAALGKTSNQRPGSRGVHLGHKADQFRFSIRASDDGPRLHRSLYTSPRIRLSICSIASFKLSFIESGTSLLLFWPRPPGLCCGPSNCSEPRGGSLIAVLGCLGSDDSGCDAFICGAWHAVDEQGVGSRTSAAAWRCWLLRGVLLLRCFTLCLLA